MSLPDCIRNFDELIKNDGEKVCVCGVFYCRKEKVSFSVNELILEDTIKIILPPKVPENLKNFFEKDYEKKSMMICGRIFIKEIPEEYKIIGRRSNPYLVDLFDIRIIEENRPCHPPHSPPNS